MHKRLLLLLTTIAALAAVAVSASVAATPTASVAAVASCATVTNGQLTIGTDNPAYPPWFGGGSKSSWKINDPSTGKGYESAVAYAIANKRRCPNAKVHWIYLPLTKAVRPGLEGIRLRHQPDLDHGRVRQNYCVQKVELRREPFTRGQQGHEDRSG